MSRLTAFSGIERGNDSPAVANLCVEPYKLLLLVCHGDVPQGQIVSQVSTDRGGVPERCADNDDQSWNLTVEGETERDKVVLDTVVISVIFSNVDNDFAVMVELLDDHLKGLALISFGVAEAGVIVDFEVAQSAGQWKEKHQVKLDEAGLLPGVKTFKKGRSIERDVRADLHTPKRRGPHTRIARVLAGPGGLQQQDQFAPPGC
ncbi:hypothetical protein BDK51DRAFT_42582 [Blyttiomyces helicus]|uniref:Uncharacterized protein n=1 Tax=Blyttiomyces helicus TaxID=388810 RepID=A0A4P9WMG1_9FUNG|nr:hypothetical protein BDK51DRAFT_42582 [Blyttiomyces helicus]|eukprot:RKO94259.1 hypothetical protein BDK51DRAFT_42582 [Blyttiomyces helicus]